MMLVLRILVKYNIKVTHKSEITIFEDILIV